MCLVGTTLGEHHSAAVNHILRIVLVIIHLHSKWPYQGFYVFNNGLEYSIHTIFVDHFVFGYSQKLYPR